MTDRTASPVQGKVAAAVAVALGGLTLWAFWPPLREMAARWWSDPQYTHGYLVPVFSAFLLWHRREKAAGVTLASSWWGLLPLAMASVLRYVASINYDYFDGLALILTLTGFVLLIGGVKALQWSWPSLAFLMFMLPLPFFVEHSVAAPLQSVATACSTYIVQTIGLPALAEGNVIVLPGGNIEIERACSGLSMLLIFFALSTAMAILIHRPLLDKIVILVSAAPIAIIANVARITATGLAQEWFGAEAAQKIFHDWAGWMMMPLALVLLWIELGLLSLLLKETEEETQTPMTFEPPGGQPVASKSSRSVPPTGPAARGVPPIGPTPVGVPGY